MQDAILSRLRCSIAALPLPVFSVTLPWVEVSNLLTVARREMASLFEEVKRVDPESIRNRRASVFGVGSF